MNESRREFIKKAAVVGTVATVGAMSAQATISHSSSIDGVVKGKSPKREITYAKTQHWDAYYQSAQ
ncbi:MAG: twin-arginine translocation signal domain-containing protein [Campylobacterales bacterium]|nr:twin-arginine translocation signal domain-containing protein [Campylobacterales bacterium]